MPDVRAELTWAAQQTVKLGLGRGSTGNLSARSPEPEMFWLTPSAVPFDDMIPQDAVPVINGVPSEAISGRKPSSEWLLHHTIYQKRPEVQAIVHTHSPAAVAVSCMRKGLPPFHYMIARFGGPFVRCSEYALFGTQELAEFVSYGLRLRKGVIMANHGQLTVGASLEEALSLAQELEDLCAVYLQVEDPVLLSMKEMHEAVERFQSYGQ